MLLKHFEPLFSVNQIDKISLNKLFIFDSSAFRLFSKVMQRIGSNQRISNLTQQMINFIFFWKNLGRRLTLNERIVIDTLLKENMTKSYIAKYPN